MKSFNFSFLVTEYPQLAHLGRLAEYNMYIDPSNALIKLRIFTEKVVAYIIDYEGVEHTDYKDQSQKIQVLHYEGILSKDINDFFHQVRKSGNNAAHSNKGTSAEAKFMLRKTLKIAQWFYSVYEEEIDFKAFVEPGPQESSSKKIAALEAELKTVKESVKNYQEKIQKLSQTPVEQKGERRAKANKAILKLQETEAETRERIDQQLREAGWECDTKTINYRSCRTLPEKGKDKAIAEWRCGNKWADYALFCGLELVGIVEAKRHSKDVRSALVQAKMYSELVEESHGLTIPKHGNSAKYKVPFLFSTNGRPYLEQIKTASGIWFWDARKQTNLARPLRQWFSPRNLKDQLTYDPSIGAKKLAKEEDSYLSDNDGLNLRPYQLEAIKAIEYKLLHQPEERQALIAMATGTGKTRTIIGMCYRLIKSGYFKRILFLVDRRILGTQAQDSFKEVKVEGLKTFAEIYGLQGFESTEVELDTKIYFATVQSMVKRVVYSDDAPSIGAYDCIVVDEAHRGYTLDKGMGDEELLLRDQLDFQSKYRMVLDYFDAYRIGLTATPAVHTEQIFGEPVFNYSYRKAVAEGYLIDFEPPYLFKTKLGENGIVWREGDELKVYDTEDNEIKDVGTTEDEIKVEIQGFNRRVINDSFNRTIIKEFVQNPDYNIDPESKKKTLIFAATDMHADMIVDILYEEFDAMGMDVDANAITKITGSVYNRKDLLRSFKNDQYPSIVVTVDLLTTGIDVPSICNLVFFRQVKSRILYDQMIGRATRQCPDIGKDIFRVFDAAGVTEIMARENAQVMKPVAPTVQKSFVDLAEELAVIEDDRLREVKLDRILAKLQRKIRSLNPEQMERFNTLAGEKTANALGQELRTEDKAKLADKVNDYQALWTYLDQEKGRALQYATLYSEHEDVLEEVTRAYGDHLKPKDYIESFMTFIQENKNQVAALNIICTKPSDLTRKDLKELKYLLDENGYTPLKLNAAHKELTSEEIVADIITHVRRAALNTSLISHEERINRAVEKLKQKQKWNTAQIKWLDNIRKQLLKESIITIADLDKAPFKQDGGLRKLNKVFGNKTADLIRELNTYLYESA